MPPLDRVLLRVFEQSVADANPLVLGRDQQLVAPNADAGLAAQRDGSRWAVVAGDEHAVVVEGIQDAGDVPAPVRQRTPPRQAGRASRGLPADMARCRVSRSCDCAPG